MQSMLFLLLALPVIAAQHFSIEQRPTALISALLSLIVLIVALGQFLARLKPGIVRNVAGLTLITLLGCYFFGQFVSYYLQGSYFNQQFYFHLNLRSVTETWSVYWPLAVVNVSAVAGCTEKNAVAANRRADIALATMLMLMGRVLGLCMVELLITSLGWRFSLSVGKINPLICGVTGMCRRIWIYINSWDALTVEGARLFVNEQSQIAG